MTSTTLEHPVAATASASTAPASAGSPTLDAQLLRARLEGGDRFALSNRVRLVQSRSTVA